MTLLEANPPTLPPAPGFQRIGWHGIVLALPDQWNLRLHHGDARTGALIFADLRSTRLEIRWQTPRHIPFLSSRNPARTLDTTVRLLQKNHPEATLKQLSPAAAQIVHAHGTLLLVAHGPRLYELHWPNLLADPTDNSINLITDDFLANLPPAATDPNQFWSIYGATGWIPAAARLRKASLLPGATTLSFKYRRTTTVLGAFSMADRLLAPTNSLRQWASSAIPLIADHPAGIWQESPDAATFTADTHRWLRPTRHVLQLRHDRPSNRIIWTHTFAPVRG